ncbi:MAG: hypothetical protein J2P57_11005 [Acidimicrobiaceae bacterium]|nr:hypothetical protein [Acidimicrobiaceae bacterium]
MKHAERRMLFAATLVVALTTTALALPSLAQRRQHVTIAAPRHTGPPLRVLLVGDSMAGTLGVGLARAAPLFRVTLINAATAGCGVAIAWDGAWASSLWVPAAPTYPCQSANQLSGYWRSLVKRYRPDVVLYSSRMDTISQEVVPGSTRRMTSVLDRGFESYLVRALQQSVGVLSLGGAHVVLATAVPTKINLEGDAADDPHRWSAYDSLLARVAAGSDGRVTLFDLGRYFGGRASSFALDSPSGVAWRCRDGIHISAAGGMLVAPSLFMTLREVASPTADSRATLPVVPADVANQPWAPYAKERQTMGCPL